jgi:hypothetical protein
MGAAFSCFDQILTGWTLILPNEYNASYVNTKAYGVIIADV